MTTQLTDLSDQPVEIGMSVEMVTRCLPVPVRGCQDSDERGMSYIDKFRPLLKVHETRGKNSGRLILHADYFSFPTPSEVTGSFIKFLRPAPCNNYHNEYNVCCLNHYSFTTG